MAIPRTVDPSNGNAFIIAGATRQWLISGGDSGYGDAISFSENCEQPTSSDYIIIRSQVPDYGTVTITNFSQPGDFFFCW
jgi:hypothetical protein